ncbi:hypothetical protein BGZ50_007488 [Haplosporangium sp. Z 11]|nr:hypothetical protein BGZ50_007488 [Haplosporangium sp. Z 11]
MAEELNQRSSTVVPGALGSRYKSGFKGDDNHSQHGHFNLGGKVKEFTDNFAFRQGQHTRLTNTDDDSPKPSTEPSSASLRDVKPDVKRHGAPTNGAPKPSGLFMPKRIQKGLYNNKNQVLHKPLLTTSNQLPPRRKNQAQERSQEKGQDEDAEDQYFLENQYPQRSFRKELQRQRQHKSTQRPSPLKSQHSFTPQTPPSRKGIASPLLLSPHSSTWSPRGVPIDVPKPCITYLDEPTIASPSARKSFPAISTPSPNARRRSQPSMKRIESEESLPPFPKTMEEFLELDYRSQMRLGGHVEIKRRIQERLWSNKPPTRDGQDDMNDIRSRKDKHDQDSGHASKQKPVGRSKDDRVKEGTLRSNHSLTPTKKSTSQIVAPDSDSDLEDGDLFKSVPLGNKSAAPSFAPFAPSLSITSSAILKTTQSETGTRISDNPFSVTEADTVYLNQSPPHSIFKDTQLDHSRTEPLKKTKPILVLDSPTMKENSEPSKDFFDLSRNHDRSNRRDTSKGLRHSKERTTQRKGDPRRSRSRTHSRSRSRSRGRNRSRDRSNVNRAKDEHSDHTARSPSFPDILSKERRKKRDYLSRSSSSSSSDDAERERLKSPSSRAKQGSRARKAAESPSIKRVVDEKDLESVLDEVFLFHPPSQSRDKFTLPSPSRKKSRVSLNQDLVFLSDDDVPTMALGGRDRSEDVCPYCGDALPLPKDRSSRLVSALNKVLAALAQTHREQQQQQRQQQRQQQQQQQQQQRQQQQRHREHGSSRGLEQTGSFTDSTGVRQDCSNTRQRQSSIDTSPVQINSKGMSRSEYHHHHPVEDQENEKNDGGEVNDDVSQKPTHRLSLMEKFEFCRVHIAEEMYVPMGKERQYPSKIDFSELGERVRIMEPQLREIIQGKKASTFLNRALHLYEKVGIIRARHPHTVLAGVPETMPGYYGSKGSAEIFKILAELFLETHILTSEQAHPQKPVEYVQQVLIPEVGLRLIAEDKGISFEDARQVMLESVEFGSYMHDIESNP